MTISMRPMLSTDMPALADLFQQSIIVLCEEDYAEEQREAWAAQADAPAFAKMLNENLTLLALHQGELAGFATLKGKDSVAMLYVHPHHARQGVATALVDALERLSAARRLCRWMLRKRRCPYLKSAAIRRKGAIPSPLAMSGWPIQPF